jgi:tetratricopeptide (TPR) repeat protein/class 3 adenylate cyclase
LKNLIPYFIQHQFQQKNNHGYFNAYTMFIDLSGFTPLTETLMERGNEGAEELSIILNKVFEPMVSLVYRRNGFIPYFAGDAFTAIFPKKEMRHPWEIILTAQELRDFFNKKEVWETRFGAFEIRIKIGLACGNVEWGIVGEETHKSYYFRGDAIDDCAASEHYAQQQDIILSNHLQKELTIANGHFKPIANGFYKLVKDFAPSNTIAYKDNQPKNLSVKVAQSFLLDPVIKFNQQGEFRSVITVFISFEGANNHRVLNSFVSAVVNAFYKFSGYFKEVDFGDKGGVMVGFFGAPVSFENNAERALELITEINEAVHDLQKKSNLRYRVGITSGVAYAGIVGGIERCQYAVVGNRVNLAARLMMKADWGDILVDREIQKSRNFRFKHKGDIHYKGILHNVPTYVLKGRNISDEPIYNGKIVGRDKELQQLKNFTQQVFKNNKLGLAYVYGEAGIGKSRISFELKKHFQKEAGISWFSCQADQILRKPFNPFVYFLKNYFEQSPENSKIDNRTAFERRFQWLLNDIGKIKHPDAKDIYLEISRTRSVLAAQIGIRYPDSLWEQLDAKGRYQNILIAIITIFKAEALIRPLLIELEDGHWFDENSMELLTEIVRQLKDYPVCLLTTSRYKDDGTKPLLIAQSSIDAIKPSLLIVDLKFLDPDALKDFVVNRMKGDIDQEFFELLLRSANGNPFYAEQILEYFTESDLLEKEDGVWHIRDKSIKVSSSINSILMARIDRLSSLVKETVKAAAVIGREFELPVLTEVMISQHYFEENDHNALDLLKAQIKTAEQGQIWRAMNELRYIFKHSLLREAVYEMQLRTRLRELHFLIAKAIEKVYADNLSEKYLDLSFHYEHADAKDIHNEYTKKAADYARKNFQNKQALSLYDKLLNNLKAEKGNELEIVKIQLRKASILELIGEWSVCEKILVEAITIAPTLNQASIAGQAYNNFGNLLMLKGQYEKAQTHLEKAAHFFQKIDDGYGIFKVYGNLGNLYFRQGRYKKAEEFFIKSIRLSEQYDYTAANAQIVANLGLTYMNEGNYEEGIRWQQSQLEICKQAKDKQGMATLYTNMGIVHFEQGDYDAALKCYTEGLALSQELGNKQLTAIATGCIGSVYERKGDYQKAMHHFEKDLELVKELGDKQGIAITLGLIGDLHTVKGEFDKAIQYLERQLALCRELSYQKGIAKAVNTLGDIYFYKDQFDISVNYYDLAIEVTRQINNRLVLGSSLIEKGKPLVSQGKIKAAKTAQQEALAIALELGNLDLVFDAKILGARVACAEGDIILAKEILNELLKMERNQKEKADIFFELYKIDTSNQYYQQNALNLYQNLYSETPQFLFRKRIQQLILGR